MKKIDGNRKILITEAPGTALRKSLKHILLSSSSDNNFGAVNYFQSGRKITHIVA
jgi:hypothetical protein